MGVFEAYIVMSSFWFLPIGFLTFYYLLPVLIGICLGALGKKYSKPRWAITLTVVMPFFLSWFGLLFAFSLLSDSKLIKQVRQLNHIETELRAIQNNMPLSLDVNDLSNQIKPIIAKLKSQLVKKEHVESLKLAEKEIEHLRRISSGYHEELSTKAMKQLNTQVTKTLNYISEILSDILRT